MKKSRLTLGNFINNISFQRAQGKIDTFYPHCYSLDTPFLFLRKKDKDLKIVVIPTLIQKHVGSESSRVIVSKSVLVRLFGVLCLLLRNHQTPFEAH